MSRVIAIWQGGSGPPQRNDRFIPVINLIRQHQMLNRPVLTPVCPTMEKAEEVRKSIYTSCRYYCSCGQRNCTRKHNNINGCPDGGQRIGCRADVVRDSEGKLRVQVKFYDKKESIRHVVAKYGPDPSKWPYQSKARKAASNDV